MILKGKVVTGAGNFSYWIGQLHELYKLKTGMDLYPGTLNVELEQPYHLAGSIIRLEKEEYNGTVSVSILPCFLLGRSSFILRTDKNARGEGDSLHQLHIIEVASDVKFRDAFRLNDGDLVEVEVPE
jgi:riboflavin kinase